MHFLFSLLIIKGLYVFQELLAHIFWRCYTNGTWYIACVLCQLAAPGLQFTAILVQPTAIRSAPPEDEQVMLEPE
jgi:hypothetical protein